MKTTKRALLAPVALLSAVLLGGCAATMPNTNPTEATSSQTSQNQGRPGQGVTPSEVTTEADLVSMIQSAYGEAQLGLHRGHEPVQDVLDATLTVTHDELHSRMDNGQNLAAIAEDLGVGNDVLVDALVNSWAVAIDNLVSNGTITSAQGVEYRSALRDAFTFKTTWDGSTATPSFTGLN